MVTTAVPRRKDRDRRKNQENGQYAGSREGWLQDRRRESSALCIMMVGCVKAVFWTGSAAPFRATEVDKRINANHKG